MKETVIHFVTTNKKKNNYVKQKESWKTTLLVNARKILTAQVYPYPVAYTVGVPVSESKQHPIYYTAAIFSDFNSYFV